MFKEKRNIWIAVIIVALLVVAGGYWAYTSWGGTETEAAAPAEVQTAVARRGDLVIYASGAGSVIPATEIGLGFTSSGTLSELLVQVGDKVQQGDVLARLQTNETEASIAAAVTAAELAVIDAQNALDALYENWEMDAAQALLAVEEAELALETIQDPELRQAEAFQALAEAQDALDAAQLAYDRTQLTASQANIDAAYAQMLLAKEALDKAQANFDRYADKPEDNLQRAQALSKLSAAQQAYDSAAANYNAMIATASPEEQTLAEADLAVAQARYAEAQRAWERAQQGPTPGELALAEAELSAARSAWERIKDGPDPDAVHQAEIKLENAKAKLEEAKTLAVYIDLVAPMDGTVLEIHADVGEAVGNTPVITLADLDTPLLEVLLDETDMDKVKPGFEAEVIFDALPDNTYTGHVTEVDPSLTSVSGVAAVRAVVQLDDFAKPQTLPVGLNASVDVIGGRAEGAVLIPVEALREISPGEYAVFVMENGEPKLRMVTVGLVDFTTAEITSGLEAGEIVTTGIVDTE